MYWNEVAAVMAAKTTARWTLTLDVLKLAKFTYMYHSLWHDEP